MNKNSCVVCGTKRQRNLIFFPKYRLQIGEHTYYAWVKALAETIKDYLPFKHRLWDDEKQMWEGEYVCIRCAIYPDNQDRHYSLGNGKSYRYHDSDEIKTVLSYRKAEL